MKGKKGNYMVVYNMQYAVDYDTKLICAINIEPHKDLKNQINKKILQQYEACKNCNARNKCCSPSQTHKTTTEDGTKM